MNLWKVLEALLRRWRIAVPMLIISAVAHLPSPHAVDAILKRWSIPPSIHNSADLEHVVEIVVHRTSPARTR